MIRKTLWMAAALATGTAGAQEPRVEISGAACYTWSDGVALRF